VSEATPHAARTPSATKTASRVRAKGRRDARKVADLVRRAVDEGATTVEDIHKAIANLPLEVLERIDGFEDTLKSVRRIQEQSIGAVYNVIRRVNAEATRLAGDLLAGKPKKTARQPAKRQAKT
jgi:hypothetical protein